MVISPGSWEYATRQCHQGIPTITRGGPYVTGLQGIIGERLKLAGKLREARNFGEKAAEEAEAFRYRYDAHLVECKKSVAKAQHRRQRTSASGLTPSSNSFLPSMLRGRCRRIKRS